MMLPVDARDERALRAAFSWLTRSGLGPHFPGTPIGPYQCRQFEAMDRIEAAAKAKGIAFPFKVRVTGRSQYTRGMVEAHRPRVGWIMLGSVAELS